MMEEEAKYTEIMEKIDGKYYESPVTDKLYFDSIKVKLKLLENKADIADKTKRNRGW